MAKILSYPNFKKLYYAGLTSELGSFITETALMLTVFDLSSKNKAFLGAARAIFLFFLTVGNLIGGTLGEKFNRKQLLNFTNYARIPLILSLFVITNVYWIIFIDGMIALFTGIYNPTRQTVVNDIVPQEDIPRANALFGSTFAILHILGPFFGAYLYTTFKGINEVLTFDFLTYIVGIVLISRLNYKVPKYDKASSHILKESIDGVKHIFHRKDLFAIVSSAFLVGLAIGFIIPLLLPYVIEVLGQGEQAYAMSLSLFGVGGLVGGYLSHKLADKFGPGKIITWAMASEPIVMLIWLYFPGYYQTLFIFFVWGIFVFIRMTAQLNYVALKVENKYLSRVFSLLDLSFVFPNIASGIIVSILGNQYSSEAILKFVAISFAILILPRLFMADMKMLYHADNSKASRDTSAQDVSLE